MISVKRILVPLDFDAKAERVLDYARLIADGCGASLHLLHVAGYAAGAQGGSPAARHDVCERLKALLTDDDRRVRHATVSCVVGTPAHEIARFAATDAIDLIVMGTHSHGPAFRMATGSIADTVTGLSPCAVLTVKGAAEAAGAVFGNDLAVASPS